MKIVTEQFLRPYANYVGRYRTGSKLCGFSRALKPCEAQEQLLRCAVLYGAPFLADRWALASHFGLKRMRGGCCCGCSGVGAGGGRVLVLVVMMIFTLNVPRPKPTGFCRSPCSP